MPDRLNGYIFERVFLGVFPYLGIYNVVVVEQANGLDLHSKL
jgi:hypothetical protein